MLCQVPSCGSPPKTGTVTDGAMIAGNRWSAPWPCEPCACRYRSSRGNSRSSVSTRSSSEPAPVSMIATPAVACGTNTFNRPSPSAKQNLRTASVRSTMRRWEVSTSSTSVCTRSSLRKSPGNWPENKLCHIPEAIASGNRSEEGIWWDRWRHRGAAPTEEGSTVYARSTTIQAQPLSVDIGIAHVRDVVIPALQEMNGCVGMSLLVDRQSGTCIATSAWETMDTMRAAAERVAPIRDRAALMFDGSAKVEEWDIALLHRDHRSSEGACVRATWLKVVPDQLGRSLDFYRTSVLPEMENLDGFCSASMMVDHPACRRAVSCSTFDSMDAMARNRDRATELRSRRVRDLGAEVVDVAEFELAIARLRVPELI